MHWLCCGAMNADLPASTGSPDAGDLSAHVVYSDTHIVVCDKPAELLSVPGRGPAKADCLSARVQAQFADALVVHRLDMATSGLIVLARGAAWQRTLSMRFAARQVHKQYVAVVAGWVRDEAGEIALPLAADWPNRPRQQVDLGRGKPALTHWQVMSRDPVAHTTRLLLTPVTGRSHQLRVHLAAIGHPILGDDLYFSVKQAGAEQTSAAPRLLLHASRLDLGPADGDTAAWVFVSPAPF